MRQDTIIQLAVAHKNALDKISKLEKQNEILREAVEWIGRCVCGDMMCIKSAKAVEAFEKLKDLE